MAIARIAPNAETSPRVLFVEPYPQRNVKRLKSGAFQIVVQMLNALFVTHGWIFIRSTGPGLSRIFTSITVYLIKVFGFGVIRLQLVITDGPGRRDAAVMTNLAKVFFS